MKIFLRLLYSDPQVLVDLDNYQHLHYGIPIEVITEEPEPAVIVQGQVEDTEEIDRLMRQPPKSPVRVK